MPFNKVLGITLGLAEMTIGELAKKSGVNAGHLSMIRDGLHQPTEKTMRKIATVLPPIHNAYFGDV